MRTPLQRLADTCTALIPLPLIVGWAFANFIYSNRYEPFLFSQLATYFIGMTLAFAIPTGVALMAFPSQRRQIAIMAYLIVATMFMLPGIIDMIGPGIRQRYIIVGGLVIAIAAGYVIQRWVAGRRYVLGFSLAFILVGLMPLGKLWAHYLTMSDDPSRAAVPIAGDAVRRHNVYFILLDAYARADQLQARMGFDNGPFKAKLQDMGFFVADQSYASYPRTDYSVGTTFRMAYAPGLEPSIRKTLFTSAAFVNFRKLGYRLVFMPQLQDQIGCPDGFECYFHESTGSLQAIGSLGINLLGMLPTLPTMLDRFFPALHAYKTNEIDNLRGYLERTRDGRPSFLYAHFDMPHPPYLRDAQCNPVPAGSRDVRAHAGWGQESSYLGYLQCGNRKLLDVIPRIIKRDPDAVIILQSDHGPYFRWRPVAGSTRRHSVREGERWHEDALEETYGTLNAWRLPDGCRKWLSPDLSPINTFRLVFACLTDSAPEFLPNRSFWIHGDNEKLTLVREHGDWVVPMAK